MGCSTSHSNDENNDEDNRRRPSENQTSFMTPSLEKLLRSKNSEDLLRGFVQLERAIMEEESRSPSSLFGLAMSRQHQIKAHLQAAVEAKNPNEILSGESSIFDLFNDLGLVKNPKNVAENEEFFASINRRAINQQSIDILQKMLETVEDQIKNSSERISQLQSAYHQQDELLGQIFGETYGSETERFLEKELDTMRYYRDMLSIGVLQWEVCMTNIQTAASLLEKGVSSWTSIKSQTLENEIILATETRNCLQEAAILIQTSEELLQDVQFPFCTTRELRAVSQATDYVFTDILIEERYLHAGEVYKNFLQRATSLREWIQQVLNSKLQKDLFEIEERVSTAANQLRKERIYLICKKLKIKTLPEDVLEAPPPLTNLRGPILGSYSERRSNRTEEEIFDYDKFPVNLESKLGLTRDGKAEDFNVQNYFRKIVENRKNTMWPSRRIDELQALVLRQ